MELANNYLSENFGFKIVELPMVISSNVSAASTSASRKAAITQKSKVASSSNQLAQSFALISNLSIDDRALIPRTSRDPLKLAIIQIILVVIKLSADNLDHQTLVSSLINLGLILDKNSEEMQIGKLVDVLDDLKKDRYILKTKQPLSNNSFYSWGPRAFVEFPPENLANLLFKVNYHILLYFVLNIWKSFIIFLFRLQLQAGIRTLLNRASKKKRLKFLV